MGDLPVTTTDNDYEAVRDNSLSPELVQKVADKVYALWLKDLQIERERYRAAKSSQNWSKRR